MKCDLDNITIEFIDDRMYFSFKLTVNDEMKFSSIKRHLITSFEVNLFALRNKMMHSDEILAA